MEKRKSLISLAPSSNTASLTTLRSHAWGGGRKAVEGSWPPNIQVPGLTPPT